MAGDRAASGPVARVSTPEALAEQVAAIMAAVEVVWPRPQRDVGHTDTSRWRFSGRWWSKPVPVRRDRPW